MTTVSPSFVSEVIDFAPTEQARGFGFAKQQNHGTAALFRGLYTKLAVRTVHLKPDLHRTLLLTPCQRAHPVQQLELQ